MKTKEELDALKNEVETLNKKLAELSDDELAHVIGGVGGNGVILVDTVNSNAEEHNVMVSGSMDKYELAL